MCVCMYVCAHVHVCSILTEKAHSDATNFHSECKCTYIYIYTYMMNSAYSPYWKFFCASYECYVKI